MKIGITLPQAGQQATRENVIQMANLAEKEGFDSLWVFERLLWPINPQTPYPATPDGSLPIEYQIMLDPLETLTYVAANTNKIALGTSVTDMLFHNPVVLARRFATLDVLSEGRAICGLGIGWSKDEYQASNIPFEHRGKRANEFVQALKKIWTDDIVEFKGKFYNIPASKIGPKPIQKPHPPIYIGGFSPKTFSRIVKYDANGWLASISGAVSLESLDNNIKILKDKAAKANKNPNDFRIVVLLYPGRYSNSNKEKEEVRNSRIPFTGTIDEMGSDLQKIKEMEAVDHVIFSYNFSSEGRDMEKMIQTTKQLSKFAT